MGAMPLPEGVAPLTADEGRLALAYYERRAPEVLPNMRNPIDVGAGTARGFRVQHFTPRGLENERVPAVSHVAAVRLHKPDRWDLLVSEMRTSTAMVLTPWSPAQAQLRPLRNGLNYPAFTQLADLDGDGRPDLLTAALGSMNPTEQRLGSVLWSRQAEQPGFHAARPLAAELGRVAALQCADLDGDGDQDVVAAAFGLHQSGELVLLRNQSGADGKLRLQKSVLDPRDGYLGVEIWDVNGDQRLDIVTLLAQEHEEIVVYLQGANGDFAPQIVHKAPHPGWGYSSMQAMDMDGDGDRDLLVTNGDTLDNDQLKPYHGVAWFEKQDGLTFVEHRIGALHGCERAVAADIDGDGDLDAVAVSFLPHLPLDVWQARNLDSVVWFERDGSDWHRHVIERQRCIHAAVAANDFDGDGKVDIAVGNFVWMLEDDQPALRSDYLTLFTQE